MILNIMTNKISLIPKEINNLRQEQTQLSDLISDKVLKFKLSQSHYVQHVNLFDEKDVSQVLHEKILLECKLPTYTQTRHVNRNF